MNILFICCHERYKCINRTYKDIVQKYVNTGKYLTRIVYTNDIFSTDDFQDYNPEMVVFFDIDTIRYGDKFKFVFTKPVYLCSLDYFYLYYISNDEYVKKCSGFITFPIQEKIMKSYKEIFPNKLILSFNGRFVNTSIFKNYNQEKKYDILIYGTRKCINSIENHDADQDYKLKWEHHNKEILPNQHNFYPLRVKLEFLLLKHPDKYRLKILEPSGSLNAVEYVNESLSNIINQSWMTLACSSRVDILMDKYVEISASHSAILGNIPLEYADSFKDNIIEVTEWMTDEEILSTIDKALEDKQKLQEKINNMADIVKNNFDLNSAVKNMDRVFDQIKGIKLE